MIAKISAWRPKSLEFKRDFDFTAVAIRPGPIKSRLC